MALVDEIASICLVSTEVDFRNLIGKIFGAYDITQIRMLLALLAAMKRIERNENGDIFHVAQDAVFMECDDSDERLSLRASWLAAYEQHLPEAIVELRGKGHATA